MAAVVVGLILPMVVVVVSVPLLPMVVQLIPAIVVELIPAILVELVPAILVELALASVVDLTPFSVMGTAHVDVAMEMKLLWLYVHPTVSKSFSLNPLQPH